MNEIVKSCLFNLLVLKSNLQDDIYPYSRDYIVMILNEVVNSLNELLPEEKQLYLCDPEINTDCKKTGCHKNSGSCYLTTNKEFSR